MPSALEGWTRHFVPNGVLLTHPDPSVGRIRVVEREPLVSVPALVAAMGHGLPAGARFELVQEPRQLETAEGEYAGFLVGRVDHGAQRLERQLGVVIGDEHCTLLDGRVERPDLFAGFRQLVLELTVNTSLGLGAQRWRRFVYDPPPGWHGVGRARSDVWLAPGYPKDPAMLTVFRARPHAVNEAVALHHRIYEMTPSGFVPDGTAQPIVARAGLQGHSARLSGPQTNLTSVALEDDTFVYPLRLETGTSPAHQHDEVLASVIHSMRRLPRARIAADAATNWSD
jgi:hypothetical protein